MWAPVWDRPPAVWCEHMISYPHHDMIGYPHHEGMAAPLVAQRPGKYMTHSSYTTVGRIVDIIIIQAPNKKIEVQWALLNRR